MKLKFITLILLSGSLSCTRPDSSSEGESTRKPPPTPDKPKVSFTFDDGITKDLAGYTFEDWNQKILSAMKEEEIKSLFFVTGSNKLDEKGKFLLKSWSDQGHKIGNHTYNHPNFNSKKYTVNDFEVELKKADEVISAYPTSAKLFRFPYLKEGNSREKIDGIRAVLAKHGYRNGHVSIDASDWYINDELIKSINKEGKSNPKVELYKQYYLEHILDRAIYYDNLSFALTGRKIPHILLLHHNLSSALFLRDLIQEFKDKGWEIVDAEEAFQDEIYSSQPSTVPAGESIIWSLAKETGKYDDILRYPAEDSRYEIPKMKKLGI